MATLDDAITAAIGYVGGLTGIQLAPTEPPEKIGDFPFVAGYPSDGEWIETPAGLKTGLHNVIIELHVARKDLPFDYALAIPYVDSIPNVLMSNLTSKWAGTISTFDRITYRWGEMEWGSQKTLGLQFIVQGVKIQSAVS
jgi:hypothetical protein